MTEYRRGAHTVYEIHLHLAWKTEYRKPALAGDAATRMRDMIRGNLWDGRCENHEVTYVEGSCAYAGFDTTAGGDQ